MEERKVITAEEFMAFFENANEVIVSEKETITVVENIVLNMDNCKAPKLLLSNIHFDKDLTIYNIKSEFNILINNCEIKKLYIKNSIFDNIRDYIIFGNENTLDFFYTFSINDCNIGNIEIEDSIFKKMLYISKTTIHKLILSRNAFFDFVTFTECNITKLNIGNKNIFEDDLNIINCKVNTFKIQNTDVKGRLGIRYLSSHTVHIENSKFLKFSELVFGENIFNHISLHIKACVFENLLKIYQIDIKIEINELYLYFSPYQSGSINIKGIKIVKTILLYDNHKGNVTFENTQFEYIKFRDLYNYSNLTFSSCEAIAGKESIFSIENSNLGKAQFYDFDFASFSNINIKNAVLTEIVTANVTWFLPEKLNQTEEKEKDEKYYKNQREVYRQLKQSTDKQGDRIQSLDFQAEEMKVYSAQLKLNKTNYKVSIYLLFPFLCGLFKSMFFIGKGFGSFMNNDKFILWLSQTNDFGLSWKKPTWLLVRITLWVYIILLFTGKLFYDDLDLSINGLGYFIAQISYANLEGFFQLFNPTRSLKDLFSGINLNPFVHFLDISHRLIFGFFVFQIASGFRKYVK